MYFGNRQFGGQAPRHHWHPAPRQAHYSAFPYRTPQPPRYDHGPVRAGYPGQTVPPARYVAGRPSRKGQPMVRLAAIGDIHARAGAEETLRGVFQRAQDEADLLLIAGDLTDAGLEEDARRLGRVIDEFDIPIFAVLGNHDFHQGQQNAIRRIVEKHGVHILDGEGVVFEQDGVRLGIAGAVGFGGGFRPYNLTPFGEGEWKQLHGKIVEETRKLDRAFAAVSGADYLIGLTHYAPTAETMGEEPEQLFPYLGSSELGDALERYNAFLGVHGHAHRGRLEGCTANGVPVFNVAMPIVDCPVVWEFKPAAEYQQPPSATPRLLRGRGVEAESQPHPVSAGSQRA